MPMASIILLNRGNMYSLRLRRSRHTCQHQKHLCRQRAIHHHRGMTRMGIISLLRDILWARVTSVSPGTCHLIAASHLTLIRATQTRSFDCWGRVHSERSSKRRLQELSTGWRSRSSERYQSTGKRVRSRFECSRRSKSTIRRTDSTYTHRILRLIAGLHTYPAYSLSKCISIMEYFDYRNHICLVTPLLGQSVFDFLKGNSFQPFPEAHIQSFARDLLSSLSCE